METIQNSAENMAEHTNLIEKLNIQHMNSTTKEFKVSDSVLKLSVSATKLTNAQKCRLI